MEAIIPYLIGAGIALVVALLFHYLWSNRAKVKAYLPMAEALLKKGMDSTVDIPDKLDWHDAISLVHNLTHYASQTVNDPENATWDDVKDEVMGAVKDGLASTPYEGYLNDEWLERIVAGAMISAEHLPKIEHGKLDKKSEE